MELKNHGNFLFSLMILTGVANTSLGQKVTTLQPAASMLCPPQQMPCLVLPDKGTLGGNIIPADFISPDAALLARLGKSFSVTVPANSTALIEVGGVKLSPRQLDPAGKGGTFVFTFRSQKKDLKGNNVFSFNVARK